MEQSIWDVVYNLVFVNGISVSAAFVANWIAPIKPGRDKDDGRDGDAVEPLKPEPTGGDHIDWDKFHKDLSEYSKEIEQVQPVGAGIR